MKKQEEKLRDFVKTMRVFWVLAYPYDPERPDDGSKIAELRNRMDELLDATSTPEMEQATEWLALEYAAANITGAKEGSGEGKQYWQGYADCCEAVLLRIYSEHGYGEQP